MRLPTRNDVARYAKVSGATVSRVLSGRTDIAINATTRVRVMEAAAALGYRPNQAARSLVTGRTNTVGLLITDTFPPFYGAIARCMTQKVEQHGFRVAVQHVHDYEVEAVEVDIPLQWQVDGLLACDLPPAFQNHIASLRQFPVPVVTMGVSHGEQGDYVGVDLLTGAMQAMRHLVAQGYRRIALMLCVGTFHLGDPRCLAYQTVLQSEGLEQEFIFAPDIGRPPARKAIGEYVAQHGYPDAIFCRNDDLAIGCYRGLLDVGLRIPTDVAVVGCDGIEDTEYLESPLTTIVQPIDTMCTVAWQYLEHRMADPSAPPQQIVLPSELAQRASSLRVL